MKVEAIMEQPLVQQAWAIARIAHAGQVDKIGAPYIQHPLAVAKNTAAYMLLNKPERGKFDVQEYTAIALLHDVIEDTELERQDLIDAGMSREIASAVEVLSIRAGETRKEYYDRIRAGDPGLKQIKVADMRHNSRPDRLIFLDDATQLRLIIKYANGIHYMEHGEMLT